MARPSTPEVIFAKPVPKKLKVALLDTRNCEVEAWPEVVISEVEAFVAISLESELIHCKPDTPPDKVAG